MPTSELGYAQHDAEAGEMCHALLGARSANPGAYTAHSLERKKVIR
jgi:hypothetical protein